MSQFDSFPERRGTDSIKWSLYDPDVIPLWLADMDFRSPDCVQKALSQRIEHGIFGYPQDSQELKQAICEWTLTRYHWQIEPDAVILLPGLIVGFNLIAQSVGEPGKGIIIQPPIYPPFLGVARNAGMVKMENLLRQDKNGVYQIDFADFEKQAQRGAQVFLLCNPHNPTGRVFTIEELERLVDICLKHELFIISDEIHADLVFAPGRHIPIASIDPLLATRSATLLAPSKTFNIPGLGCAVAVVQDADLRKKIQSSGRGMLGHVNLLGQVAANAAYREGAVWLDELLGYLQGNRDFLMDFIRNEMPEVHITAPEGTYLVWMDFRGTPAAADPVKFFLDNARVGLFPGNAFGAGGDGFARLNFACPKELLGSALQKMAAALHKGA